MDAEPALFSGLFSAILIGGLAGWLAGKLVRGGGFGLIGNVILGIGGAILANFALPFLGFSFGGGFISSVFHSMLGAAIVLILIRMIKNT